MYLDQKFFLFSNNKLIVDSIKISYKDLTDYNIMFLFILNILSYDIWFYFCHRLLHTSYIYKYHQKHHTIKEPNWFDTYYASMVENCIL